MPSLSKPKNLWIQKIKRCVAHMLKYVIVFMKASSTWIKLSDNNPNVLLVNSNAKMSLCITNAVIHSVVNNKMYD